MAPPDLYRVIDKSSRAYYVRGQGIFAEDLDTMVDFRKAYRYSLLYWRLRDHLDWASDRASPFISTYSSLFVAEREARRRVRAGKEDVRIYKIDTAKCGRFKGTVYRNVQPLAERMGLWIEVEAYNNSKYEWIFYRHVPARAVVELCGWHRE